jgi:hypothetical protein
MSGTSNFIYYYKFKGNLFGGLAFFFSFVFAAAPALAGLDLALLQRDINTRQVPRVLYRMFYVCYLVNNSIGYAVAVIERASCEAKEDATLGEFLITVVTGISIVGALVPLMKITIRKILFPMHPAVRFAQRSAVVVNVDEDSGADRSLLLMVSPGAVTLLQVRTRTEMGFGALWQVHVVLSKRYARHILIWSVLCALVYLPVSGSSTGVTVSELRLDVRRLCFHQHPPSALSSVLALATAGVTIAVLLTMFAILAANGFSRAMLIWTRFWLSRSVVFMVISLLRGLMDFFTTAPLTSAFSTLVTFFILAPLILSLADLLCLLRPRRVTTTVITMVYLFLLVSQITSYGYALSTDNPCAGEDSTRSRPSLAIFIVFKIISSARLVYYYKLIALCLLKIIDIDLPAIDLDPRARLSTNLPSSLESIKEMSTWPQIGLVTEL